MTAHATLDAAIRSPTSILARVNSDAVSANAKIESRNREVHLPPISAFRWWARRTQAVNGAILDAFAETFGKRRLVVDPFAGGGTIGLAALARGHRAYVQDINPWATHGLKTMLALPAADKIWEGAAQLGAAAQELLEDAYATSLKDGSDGRLVHTYRVATGKCSSCGVTARLFPYALLTLLVRKERKRPEAYLACRCGHVFVGRLDADSPCPDCGETVDPLATYTRRREVICAVCGHTERLQVKAQGSGLLWEVVLVERASQTGTREFDVPTLKEIAQASEAMWPEPRDLGKISVGRETSVLLRHGFIRWNDLFPRRQQVVTQSLLDLTTNLAVSEPVKDALRLAIVGSVEFAGHLSRWDRWYLKCNDATAGHRFNFSTFVPEPNVWGADAIGRGTVQRRIRSLTRGSNWLHDQASTNIAIECRRAFDKAPLNDSDVTVVSGSSEQISLRDDSADLVLTDPPYHDDVQYAELSLLFRTWAGLPMEPLEREAAVNYSIGLNSSGSDYLELLTMIFDECRRVLKDEGRLVFSYANRQPEAWIALFSSLQDAGFFAFNHMVVHSENETDYAKRDVRACTKDFVMELIPRSSRHTHLNARHHPPRLAESPGDAEEAFLARVAEGFYKIGHISESWRRTFTTQLYTCEFLARPSKP